MLAAAPIVLDLLKKLWPVVLFGVMFAMIMTYRGLYQKNRAESIAAQQNYKSELIAAKTCSDAAAALAGQLSVKNAKLQAAELDAAARVAASAQRSKTLAQTIDKGKSCDQAIKDYVTSFTRSSSPLRPSVSQHQ